VNRCCFIVWGSVLSSASSLLGATNLLSVDEIPPLRPPRAELPPSFWEQYGAWPWVVGALVVLLLAMAIWLLLRPRPPQLTPPATVARQQLDPLRLEPETGAVLSRVSQVVRYYFSTAFGLPPTEFTTAEFCHALTQAKRLGPDVARGVVDFLAECDLRKFSPSPPPAPLRAAETATRLIEEAERARAVVPPPVPEAPASPTAAR
jgi:hypothetical protein